MSEYNSKNDGIMYLNETEGTFGTRVPKFRVKKFSGWNNGRSASDPSIALYKPVDYPTWVLKMDGTDEHANIAMTAYIESLRGVNEALVADLLATFPFLSVM